MEKKIRIRSRRRWAGLGRGRVSGPWRRIKKGGEIKRERRLLLLLISS
jgi:hypothetical protein